MKRTATRGELTAADSTEGVIRKRPDEMITKGMVTGEIEVVAEKIEVMI